jgi:hypothetical protein
MTGISSGHRQRSRELTWAPASGGNLARLGARLWVSGWLAGE